MDADRDLEPLVALNALLHEEGADLLRTYRCWVKEMATKQAGLLIRRHGREALEERASALARCVSRPVSLSAGDPTGEWWAHEVLRPLQALAHRAWGQLLERGDEPNPFLLATALVYDHLAQVQEGENPPLFRAPLDQAGRGATLQDVATTSLAVAVSAEIARSLLDRRTLDEVRERFTDEPPPFDLGSWGSGEKGGSE